MYSPLTPLGTKAPLDSISFNLNPSTTTKIPKNLLFIQLDKPIYKPGQTLKFRIVSLDSNLLPHNQVFQTVELQGPYSNRIGQWLNQTTRTGILDLSHSMSPEAAQGYYTITAWDEKNQQISQSFEMKEYVLPKFKVNIDFPSVITIQDKEVTLKVCAKYTFDKPVLGSVNAEVCLQGYSRVRPGFPNKLDVCKKYSMMTDKTGCGSQEINVSKFDLYSGRSFKVNCYMKESGTGVTMQGSTSAVIIHDYISVRFEDTPDTYRPGMVFNGKVVVTNSQSRPMENQLVIVYANYSGKSMDVKMTTDISGTAHFSFSTLNWSEEIVLLTAKHEGDKKQPDFKNSLGYHFVRPSNYEGRIFLMLTYAPENPRCHDEITVTFRYIIDTSDQESNQITLNMDYMVYFSSSIMEPGEKIPFIVKANPGSSCYVRATDERGFGIKTANNVDVKAPDVRDIYENMFKFKSDIYDFGRMKERLGSEVEKHTEEIRESFPETWMWDLIPVGKSGSVTITKTVPDTITKWSLGAFCTSPAGFGVAPKTHLTVFKPFFVSLTLPYSVIREETFTLKATVFNYLPKCIMVKVTLADSSQFTAQPCKDCTYTQCVCSEESQTFQWIVTPSELRKVNITVRAEAVESQELCGNEVVTLPDKGRVDTVVQSVLVQDREAAEVYKSAVCIYLVTVTSQAVGGSTETLCAQIHEPKEPLTMVVTLRTGNRNLTILQQASIKKNFYKCVPFKFRTVELKDPYSNRIGQWLNQTTRIGILDLSHSMSPEAAQGYYTINAWDDKNQQISHSFELKEYVLPKYEVNIDFPSIITVEDKEVTLTVCSRYTYDKPVLGSVNAKVCVRSYNYKPGFPNKLNVCKTYSMMTDNTGCGSQVINVTEFGLSSGGSFQVNCTVEESGTGVTMQGSTSAEFIRDYISVRFEDTPDTYRPGMIFKGKIMVSNLQSRPMKNEPVILYAHYGGKNVSVTLTTDINGIARFSFNTYDWSEEAVQLWAHHKGEIKGELTITLENMTTLAPYAQVVVYTVLPSGENVANYTDIPIQDCLVFRKLPVKNLSGCPYNTEEPYTCPYSYFPHYGNRNDIYNIFTGVGITIVTNAEVPAVYDIYKYMLKKEPPVYDVGQLNMAKLWLGFGSNVEKPTQKIRSFSPETWIWDLVPVGKSGSVDIAKTVPDTITTWAAVAFCTSPAGFVVTPKTYVTAFKPFFVSLNLPYSVIREETFTLKATVFNYLTKCIMVKVTLANSPQFTAQTCRGCTYTQCVCSEESQTFQWTVTPSELGKVNITVRAEAVKSQELCGNEVVTLPDKGRIDTVMQSVLVEVPTLRG
ncbi:alpha-2-macroglobulin 1 [Labeo rohita]|uniref:Alpha-2-macroglobulin 1 n=1 Tax=Labeo rohita TaxID=84645 RepID=A0A498L6V9_LABRO|nr:alpha-2-macroglobulin 1 [Labeo rohita]